jgi:hypothetical protein
LKLQAAQAVLWGAHASDVLVAAFCGDELLPYSKFNASCQTPTKFVIAECDHQHVEGVPRDWPPAWEALG